jgi:antirestriction protein ArdC
MPPQAAFASADGYCATLLHELGHHSGHPTRLNRDLSGRFGSPDYAREELKVEIGQVMVCAELGIAGSDYDFTNNAAYVASWLETLRADRKEIFRAAADAQRIADYLLAFHPDYATSQAGPPERASHAGDAATDTPDPLPVAA